MKIRVTLLSSFVFIATLVFALPAAAQLVVNPTSITAQAYVGAAPANQTVQVTNTGKRALKWTVAFRDPNGVETPPPGWVSVSPLSGTNNARLTVIFNQAGLNQAGPYDAAFFVSSLTAAAVKVSIHVDMLQQPSPPPPPPPPPSRPIVGPQTTITCPAGAVDVWPGAAIQLLVDANVGGTAFCLHAGTHPIMSSITPKTGDIFVGEFGAVLDGSGWTTDDPAQGAFLAHNQDIDDVQIRNLLIRNMPQRGIHAFYYLSDRWTIEYNEITGNLMGVSVPNGSVVRNNYIHDNREAGYLAYRASNTIFESNEISNNGSHKTVAATNITFRNNFVHHNREDGIWYDGDSTGGVIEGNIVEDNAREGIFLEISRQVVVRNNTVRRNAYAGIFISTAKDIEIYGNTLEDNVGGIQYYLNCDAIGGGSNGWDLFNVNAHDNSISVGTTPTGALANGFSHVSTCTAAQLAPYLSGSKNLTFASNHYLVPSLTTKYLFWGLGKLKSWADWQALGLDLSGVYQLR